MSSQRILRSKFAVFSVALAFAGVAFAQTAADNASAGSPPSTSTTTTTVELPSVPATSAPEVTAPAVTTTTSQTTIDPSAIGSTSLTRLDTTNTAFEKLAPDRAFLTPADVAALPGFGDAFAKADRDGDGRLDRTEFSDAWAYYIGQGASAPSATTSTQTQ